MKLYLGSHDVAPEGYVTVDINPAHHPDIIADASDLSLIESNSVDEVYASALLEHIPWPRSYKALSEWVRVLRPGGILKISVPDMLALCALVAQGENPYHCIGMIFGTGRRTDPGEAHQYGYTRQTLTEMLSVLGCAELDWWHSNFSDASNAWVPLTHNDAVALMINVRARKQSDPLVDTDQIIARIEQYDLMPFMTAVKDVAAERGADIPQPGLGALTMQRLHFKLLDARQHIKHLESLLSHQSTSSPPVPSRAILTPSRFKDHLRKRLRSFVGASVLLSSVRLVRNKLRVK